VPTGGGQVNDPNAIGAQRFGIGGKIFGYRDVDFQVTKNFDLTRGMSLYMRFDILNIFNFKNYADYITQYSINGVPAPHPVSFNSIGNITGVPREYKFTLGFRF
jgi:hypothetical protein